MIRLLDSLGSRRGKSIHDHISELCVRNAIERIFAQAVGLGIFADSSEYLKDNLHLTHGRETRGTSQGQLRTLPISRVVVHLEVHLSGRCRSCFCRIWCESASRANAFADYQIIRCLALFVDCGRVVDSSEVTPTSKPSLNTKCELAAQSPVHFASHPSRPLP